VRYTIISLVAVATTAGCQQYQPKPLDLPNHRASWELRTPDVPEVAEFAQEMAETGRLAEPFDVTDGIGLGEAEVLLLVFNPQLREARATAKVASANARFAGLWDDPVLSLDLMRILESVPDPWILGTSVGFTIPLSGRLEVEKARANAEEFAAIARVARSEWELVNELRTTWLEWSSAQLQAEVTQELVDQLGAVVDIVNRLEQAGERSLLEARLFRIEAATRAATQQRLTARALSLELAMKELLGLRPEIQLTLVPQLTLPLVPPSPEDESRILEANPALLVARAEYAVAEHTLNREIRKQYPDLSLGPAYELEEGQSRIGFLGAFPIPVLNRNRRGIAEAEASREVSRAAAENVYESLVHQFARAAQSLELQRRLREHFESTVVPLVDEQVRDARRMLELGELDMLVLLESVVRQAEAKLEFVEAQQAEALATQRVGALLGPQATKSLINQGNKP